MLRPTLFLSAMILGAAPAIASSYSAQLASAPGGRVVARDIAWNCAGSACTGATAESRPAVLCQALAKRAGRVERFAVDGQAFSAAELELCNASVKARPVTGQAAN